MDEYGRPCAIVRASSAPMPRTEPMPRRTAWPLTESAHGSSVAVSADALMSGVCTTTPWRRASRTSVCGDQNPMGWAFNNDAQNTAGSCSLIHDDEYTRYAKLTEWLSGKP